MYTVLTFVFLIVSIVLLIWLIYCRTKSQELNQECASLKTRNRWYEQENEKLSTVIEESTKDAIFYKNLFESTKDILLIFELDDDGKAGRIMEVNRIACETLGYRREELITKTLLDLQYFEVSGAEGGYSLTDDDLVERQRAVRVMALKNLMKKLAKEGNIQHESSLLTAAGRKIPVLVEMHYFDLFRKPVIMYTAEDVTNRRAAQNALDASEQKFRDFFAHSPIGIAIYDSAQQLVDVNQALMRVFGIPDRQELARINLLHSSIVPAPVQIKLARGETVQFDAAVSFDDIRRNATFVSSRSDMAYLDITVIHMGYDTNFKPRGFLVQVMDNTRRKTAELALGNSEKQLRQAEKMEALGSLAGGIAHDFNNILTPILGYTELALRSCEQGDVKLKFLEEVLKASNRAKELVNQILSFSRQKEKEGQPLHVIPIAKEALNLVSASAPSSVTVNRVIKAEHDVVKADPTQVHQIIMNLCTNSMHAMKDSGGVLEMRIMELTVDARTRMEGSNLPSGKYIRISISDTGIGMTSQTIKRIFEPFFTTKREGEGTGMGLAVVSNILDSIQGEITVESEVGKGSIFHVTIPLMTDQNIEAAIDTAVPLPGGTERVLVVDDDAKIVEMVAHMLASLGYHPMIDTSSIHALEEYELYPKRFDAVVLDQKMPGLMGDELAARMLALRPDLPIILCTAFSDAITKERVDEIGIKHMIMKPIVMKEMAIHLRQALDGNKKA